MKAYRFVPLLIVLTLIPSAVHAQGMLRWLGRLSGPGPFWGLGAEVKLKCIGVDGKEPNKLDSQAVESQSEGLRGIRYPCPDATYNPLDRHATVYLNISGSIAENNPMDYQDVGRQEESTAVRMLKIGTSIDWTVHRTLDIGTGAGVAYFAGPRFDNFTRAYVQPVRLTIRPLMVGKGSRDRWGWLLVSANWHILLGTIDGPDFGAPADPYRAHNEQDMELGVSVDILRLFRMASKDAGR